MRGTAAARLVAGLSADAALALLRHDAQDLGSLERMLLAWAVCPNAGGFDRVRLLAWDPARMRLVGRLWWERGLAESDPWASIQRARRLPGEGAWPERTRALRLVSIEPEALSGIASEAWRSGAVVVGPPHGAEAPAGALNGAVVLVRLGRPVGLMIGEWDTPGDAGARLETLRHLQGIATVALDAQARRAELARHARQAAAITKLSRTTVSPCNLREVLDTAVGLAAEATGARGGAVWLTSPAGALELRATHGAADARERLGRALQPLAAIVQERGRPHVLDRVVDEPQVRAEIAAELTSLAVLPLIAYGRTAGALAVYDCGGTHSAEPGAFDAGDLEFLGTMANLIALAEDQATRCEALRRAELRQKELQEQVSRGERMAALGEMAARAAHEVRNPLASIGAFARRVHRDLREDDPSRQHLEIVIRETERLERVVGEQLQYATLQPPRLAMESLNAVVQNVLQAEGERLVRRRVRLLKKLTPDLPALLLDSGRMRRAVSNILDHTLEALPAGGRVKVESRKSGAFVVLDIGSDAPRQPGDVMELLFVPFALSRQGEPGPGLAMSQQILKEHGGELRVRGEGEWSSVFSLAIPIPGNQDRRRPGAGRRGARSDRRERFPAG